MPEQRRTITVDGQAASGKTALSRLLAETLGFAHLNSGLLYRGTAWLALSLGLDPTDTAKVITALAQHRLSLISAPSGQCELFVDGKGVAADLTSSEVSKGASIVGQSAEIRSLLLPAQREAFPGHGIVAEGRDMGSVVFPDASVKFFVEADLGARAARRFQQMVARGEKTSVELVATELAARDKVDEERAASPMTKAATAIVIDNSSVPLEETVRRMVEIVERG
jgi:cytidylate kinase